MNRKTVCVVLSLEMMWSYAVGQIVWTKLAKNPVVPVWSGNVDDPSNYRYAYAPAVLVDPSAVTTDPGYKMWFASAAFGANTFNLSHAVSPNGIDWFFYTKNPVLTVGPSGSFDSRWVIDPCVIRVNNEFRLYYTGNNGTITQAGLATSRDGIHWTKYSGNPILTVVPGTWESIGANAPRVYYEGTSYRMIYAGNNGIVQCGYATSTDGIHWTRYAANPVMRADPGTWDQAGVQANAIVVCDGRIFLFYNATAGPMGFAVPTDWIHWEKYQNNPVFRPGPSGSWDASLAIGYASIENNVFKYWYTGMGGGLGWQIEYATSPLTYSAEPTRIVSTPSGEYNLSESYPNPFNPDVAIQYSVPSDQRVAIKVYNDLGQEVATLVDEIKSAGT